MIELNNKTQQDFLNREWVQKLLDVGVDMSDAHYYILNTLMGDLYIIEKDRADNYKEKGMEDKVFPTYTVSELLYKLHEWIYPIIDGKNYAGGIYLTKDTPFYSAFYDLRDKDNNKTERYIYAEFEYPIESLASLLIQCHQKDIGLKTKNTGNISDK